MQAGSQTSSLQMVKVPYASLNSRQKENYNFHQVAYLLAEFGYHSIRLSDDWHGADFLAYHIDGEQLLKVQLKARITIDKKYVGKGMYMVFPSGSQWYLIAHDELVEQVGLLTNWLETDSWKTNGQYHAANASRALQEHLKAFRISS